MIIYNDLQYMSKTGKDDITKTKKVLFQIMNNINNDLCFTYVNQVKYEGGDIQTLDFQLKLNKIPEDVILNEIDNYIIWLRNLQYFRAVLSVKQ